MRSGRRLGPSGDNFIRRFDVLIGEKLYGILANQTLEQTTEDIWRKM
jgi:hypothetical protein